MLLWAIVASKPRHYEAIPPIADMEISLRCLFPIRIDQKTVVGNDTLGDLRTEVDFES